MAKTKQFVRPSDVAALIKSIARGELFSLHFKRVAPKCTACGKSNKKWAAEGLTKCPFCGAELSFERESHAQLGVHNPSNELITPKGVGESAQEALQDGRLKYFDMDVVDDRNGKRGGYRQAAIENITRMTIKGVDYFII